MVDSFKVLGQLQPGATTLSAIYTVPGATNTVVSSIVACNTSSSQTTFRISIAPAGAADNIKQYQLYDIMIEGNNTYMATTGFTLATTDVVRVYSANGAVSFSLFGTEIT
jgi:hypothetical protein